MPKKITIGTYDKKHKANLSKRAKKVQQLYEDAVKRISRVVAPSIADADEKKEFHFDDFPALKKEMNALMQDLSNSLQANIEDGDEESWTLSNTKNDAMVSSIIGKSKLPAETISQWKHPHLEALSAFIDRKEAGMDLSKRVWNLSEQFKSEMELALELGMGQGKSAAELSRDIRKYLVYPDKLFRRVRDKSGALRLSKAAEAFHPGRGVYRSSYKNALRMTATENNIAYRTADHNRWQTLPFVLGIETRISNNHPATDICDTFDGVQFPKDFKFTGWHPWCRCYAVSVLASQEEMDAYTQAIIDGDDVSDWKFKGEINEMPEKFNQWVKDNRERISNAKSIPYFIKDNQKAVNKILKKKDERINDENNKNNLKSVAKAVGVEVGKPMNFEQADSLHPNPHFEEDVQYRVNCQSSVVAYELRRRGLPVEAFGKVKGSIGSELAHHTPAAWVDADGKIPTRIACKYTIKERTIDKRGYVHNKYSSSEDVLNDFLSQTSEPGRYHVSWSWRAKNTGHIITMETFADGSRLFYDPQTGISSKNILQWAGKKMSKFDLQTRGLCALRVDNLQPNTLVVKGVVKKVGSTAATPMASSEQLGWWAKNVTNGKSEGVNGFNKKMLKTTQELRRDKERFEVHRMSEVKNLQTGKLKRLGVPRRNLIEHLYSQEEVAAAEYAWNNPEVLRYVEKSELGAVKDMTKPEAQKNIEKKKTRGVTHYNLYEFDYDGKTWNVKLEALEDGTEQFYCMVKTRNS